MRARRGVAGAVLAVLVLAGCSAQDTGEAQDAVDRAAGEASKGVDRAAEELGEVDWTKYGRQAKRRLDRLAERADCRGLKAELAKAEPNDAALTGYIKQRIRQAGC